MSLPYAWKQGTPENYPEAVVRDIQNQDMERREKDRKGKLFMRPDFQDFLFSAWAWSPAGDEHASKSGGAPGHGGWLMRNSVYANRLAKLVVEEGSR